MATRIYLQRLIAVDSLIERKATGTPNELAERMNISVRSVYGYIRDIKELGGKVKYDRERCSYVYTSSGCLFSQNS